LNSREWAIGVALSVMIFWIGIYPSPFLRMVNGSVQEVVDRLHPGMATAQQHDSLISIEVTRN
jgi:NADH-quinone oxidoreductase subunit M